MADAALFVGFCQPARARGINTRAGLVIDGLGVVEAYVESALAAQLALYREQVAKQLLA